MNDLYESSEAILYSLTRRGFFSEFNILCFFYAYAVAHRKHLFVDDRKFDVAWSDVFSARVRKAADLDRSRYASLQAISPKTERDAWNAVRDWVRAACEREERAMIPQLGVDGPFAELVFAIAARLFKPSERIVSLAAETEARFGLRPSSFAAIQIRQGDKVAGYPKKNGRINVEGEVVPLGAYRRRIEALRPDVRDVFVMTDDYGQFEAAAQAYPELRFHTLCTPDERGYFHAEHQARPYEQRLAAVERLLASVLVAAKSGAFVGAFTSNLSAFVYMLHPSKPHCVSVDSQVSWQAR